MKDVRKKRSADVVKTEAKEVLTSWTISTIKINTAHLPDATTPNEFKTDLNNKFQVIQDPLEEENRKENWKTLKHE